MRRRALGFALALGVGLGSDARAQTYREGLFSFDTADYAAALTAWNACAETGDYRCQFGLGVLLNDGRGTPRDHSAALRWFLAAAEQGSTDGALEAGILYAIGPEGVEQDIVTAYTWLVIAARDGDPIAEERRELTRSLMRPDEIEAAEARALDYLNRLR